MFLLLLHTHTQRPALPRLSPQHHTPFLHLVLLPQHGAFDTYFYYYVTFPHIKITQGISLFACYYLLSIMHHTAKQILTQAFLCTKVRRPLRVEKQGSSKMLTFGKVE